MRVLITGVAGFIGSHIAERMLDAGHEVWGVDNLSTGRESNVPAGVDFTEIDIEDHWKLSPRVDVIYHCAASYRDRSAWERDARTNVLGTINVIRHAQKFDSRMVYFQTSLCYGPHPNSPVRPDAPLDPHGSYAVTKTAAEQFIRDSGVPYVSLRLANIYGPRNLSGPVPTFYKRLSEGEPCIVVDARRDYVYVADLVNVAVKAATQGQGVYHVSTGRDYSILSLWQAVRDAMGVDAEMPTPIQRGPDDVATLLIDPSATEREFGWMAQTTLEEGIASAVGWYDAEGVTETYTHLAMKG